jgi:3-oxoacyl-[acyl-carrier protein] reductase
MDNLKKILILGASSDIGIKLVENLLSNNWLVVAHCSTNSSALVKLKHKNLKIIKLNFEKVNENNYLKKFNFFFIFKYDAFVNLIGFVDKVSLKKTNLKKLFKIFKINTFFPMLIMKKIIEGMLKNSYGRILNCSSIGVKFGGGYNSFNYSFSKYALEFIPIAYKEWAKKNVLINNLRIGVTNTKIHKKMNKHQELKERIKLIPMNRMAKPEEISNYISFLISKKNSYMTGETLVASGGE